MSRLAAPIATFDAEQTGRRATERRMVALVGTTHELPLEAQGADDLRRARDQGDDPVRHRVPLPRGGAAIGTAGTEAARAARLNRSGRNTAMLTRVLRKKGSART